LAEIRGTQRNVLKHRRGHTFTLSLRNEGEHGISPVGCDAENYVPKVARTYRYRCKLGAKRWFLIRPVHPHEHTLQSLGGSVQR
jgi:hypothetical protein